MYRVIALGGSLIVPRLTDQGGIDVPFLREFRSFCLKETADKTKLVVVAGGGRTTRVYQKSAGEVLPIPNEDLDWLGIHSTRLNAHLLRTIFGKKAHPWVIDYDIPNTKVAELKESGDSLFIASGWIPGWSTDYVAVKLADKFGAKSVCIASNTPYVYDKDPKLHEDARLYRNLSWEEYRNIVPADWTPGLSLPVDPVAAQLAQRQGIEAKILEGTNIGNMRSALAGETFEGSTLS